MFSINFSCFYLDTAYFAENWKFIIENIVIK